MQAHLAPPPKLIAHQTHETSSSVFWLVPGQFEVEYRQPARSQAVKLLVSTGRARLEQSGRVVDLGPGRFTWLDPSEPHALSLREGRLLIARFSRRSLHRVHPLLDLTPARVHGEGAAERVAGRLFTELLAEGSALSAAERTAAGGTISAALGLCASAPPRSATDQHVALAAEHIAANLHRADLQPLDVAQRVGVSRRRLDAIFRATFGVTVAEAIREQRLEGAAAQLLTSTEPISALARRWGFDDASHFGRAFRRHHGRTPGEYRATSSSRGQA